MHEMRLITNIFKERKATAYLNAVGPVIPRGLTARGTTGMIISVYQLPLLSVL